MGPDPTRAYFWPAVNKGPTLDWPGYFLTLPDEIFSLPVGEKMKNWDFWGKFLRLSARPDPTQPRHQNFLTITTTKVPINIWIDLQLLKNHFYNALKCKTKNLKRN